MNDLPSEKKIMTLVVVRKGQSVLLGMKKRGFGAGRWNGFGGKLLDGESIEAAALRELSEEARIEARDIHKQGVLTFSFETEPKVLEVHIFSATEFTGEPVETEEMLPQWFAVHEIPFEQMWPDDKLWMPYLLENKLFTGSFLFDRPSTADYSAKIIYQSLEEVEGFT